MKSSDRLGKEDWLSFAKFPRRPADKSAEYGSAEVFAAATLAAEGCGGARRRGGVKRNHRSPDDKKTALREAQVAGISLVKSFGQTLGSRGSVRARPIRRLFVIPWPPIFSPLRPPPFPLFHPLHPFHPFPDSVPAARSSRVYHLQFVSYRPPFRSTADWISRRKRITNKLSTVRSIGRLLPGIYGARINPARRQRKILFAAVEFLPFYSGCFFLVTRSSRGSAGDSAGSIVAINSSMVLSCSRLRLVVHAFSRVSSSLLENGELIDEIFYPGNLKSRVVFPFVSFFNIFCVLVYSSVVVT